MRDVKRLSIQDRLGLNVFELDKEAHITVDNELCRDCQLKPCLHSCPAKLYEFEEEVHFNYEGCLECGTCFIVCHQMGNKGVNWSYPRGGFGVYYRYG
jgi:ferredoxin like protein